MVVCNILKAISVFCVCFLPVFFIAMLCTDKRDLEDAAAKIFLILLFVASTCFSVSIGIGCGEETNCECRLVAASINPE